MKKTLHKVDAKDDTSTLVKKSQEGDRNAFNLLVKRYQACAMKTALRILANADESAEAVQDAFVTAYLKIKKLRNPEKFGFWLLQIVTNYAIRRQRLIVKRRRLFKNIDHLQPAIPNHCENTISTGEIQSAIQSAMSKLTKTQIRALALFGIEELSHKEVADILGCSPGAARWHVFQARKKLKVLLKDYIE